MYLFSSSDQNITFCESKWFSRTGGIKQTSGISFQWIPSEDCRGCSPRFVGLRTFILALYFCFLSECLFVSINGQNVWPGEPGNIALFADEPSTALDVTIQNQALDLMEDLTKETNTAVLLITHNMGVVRKFAEKVYVIYRGVIVEEGTKKQLSLIHI